MSAEDEENAPQRAIHPQVLEIYSPVRLTGTNQIIAIAEYYQSSDALRSEIAAAQRSSWLILGGVMVIIYLLLSGFVRRASDTIEKQQVELNQQITRLTGLLAQNEELSQRVRRASARVAAINEQVLRRIGSELHDGPAQDLGLALLQIDILSAQLEKQPGGAENPAQIQLVSGIQTLLQNTLKEMRAIASGLSLPQLNDLSLAETILRAVRSHERRSGSRVGLEMQNLPDEAPLPVKITVYRIIQEALNNAYRHAGGLGQQIMADCKDEILSLNISDQGPGFEPDRSNSDDHLGLSGMRERVESLGGTFQMESQSGAGVRLVVHLPLNAKGNGDE
jgi:signal transduction histidine kinase